jgi:predicted permease
MVIGESLWRTRFDGDPEVIGRVVRLGAEHRTVVGVMPEVFAFPLYHNVWIPLRLKSAGYERGEGGTIGIFGRLASGATMERAQIELATLGARAAVDSRDSPAHLRPQVVPFAKSVFDAEPMVASFIINGFMGGFLLLLYANVALLMFARAATRESELVVRNALGASRGRILMQLFTEALVLGSVGAVIGLVFARLGVSWAFWFFDLNGVDLPFWYRASLSPSTIAYAVGLTLLAAVVSGVIPALEVTRGIATQLRAVSAGGGGLQFGGLWTAIIVTQVAFTVAFFPLLVSVGTTTAEARAVELGLPSEEYLTLQLDQDETKSIASTASRGLAESLEDLKRRVSEEPGVTGVTFADQFPGGYHPRPAIEVEGVPAVLPSGIRPRAQRAAVDLDFFGVMGAGVLSGRGFHSADLTSAAKVVIVNESFARAVLGDRNPIGKRLRYYVNRDDATGRRTEEPGPWYEIVGVVKDLAMWVAPDLDNQAGIYHPLSLAGAGSIRMAVHLGRNPERFAPRLRMLATAADPAMRLSDIEPLNVFASGYITAVTFWFRVMVFAGGIALLLSLAGVYSVMAFTVSRRTREIGIRVALGSGRRRIMAALFSRTLVKVGLGVLVGVAVWALFTFGDSHTTDWLDFATGFASLVAYAAVMMAVCMLACIVPALRALRVQPTEALRADG